MKKLLIIWNGADQKGETVFCFFGNGGTDMIMQLLWNTFETWNLPIRKHFSGNTTLLGIYFNQVVHE